MPFLLGLIIPLAVISIPITAIALSYRKGAQKLKIREMELQKEMMQLEIEKQNGTIKLLEEENKKFDRLLKE